MVEYTHACSSIDSILAATPLIKGILKPGIGAVIDGGVGLQVAELLWRWVHLVGVIEVVAQRISFQSILLIPAGLSRISYSVIIFTTNTISPLVLLNIAV